MTKTISFLILLLVSINVSAHGDDKRIIDTRGICKTTNERIAEAERSFPESDVFQTELVINLGGTMYPAVGHFKDTVKFYYTYGDREVSPYPNRLLKIVVATERSSAKESAEYFFDASGQLIFALESDGETENRFYFAAGKLIRRQTGEKVVSSSSRESSAAVREVVMRKERLVKVFRFSIE